MDLLGRARGFLKGLSSPPVDREQRFSVLCPLGHRLTGQRTEGYQALRCPACGEGVFVLPASPLPEPLAPPRAAPARTAVSGRTTIPEGPVELKDNAQVTVDYAEPGDLADDVEIVWDDEPVTDRADSAAERERDAAPARPSRPATTPGRPQSRPETTPARGAQPTTAPARKRAAQPAAVAARHSPAERAAPRVPAVAYHRRPALIFLAVAILVVGTVAYRTWRGRRQELPRVVELGKTEGIPALEQGKFDKAYQLLSAAKGAVDSLGGAVEDADRIRHAADEAAIFVDLIPETLEHLLDEAARTTPQAWTTRFDNIYKGRAVIIDARLIATPESSDAGRYELDYLVFPPGEGSNFRDPAGGHPRYARIDLAGFEAITLAQPPVGTHVVFGARLASFRYDSGAEEWVIGLEPGSGVAITYSKALETLGWPSAQGMAEESEATTP